MLSKGERVMVAALILAFVAAIVFLKTTWKMPEREAVQNDKGWHDGDEPPKSSLIGQPLSFLREEYFPFRYTQDTRYYLIRGGLGGWYMPVGMGDEFIKTDSPDHWIEYPPKKVTP